MNGLDSKLTIEDMYLIVNCILGRTFKVHNKEETSKFI